MAIYSLAFDPLEGSFWIFPVDPLGQGLPLRRHRFIVEVVEGDPDLTVTINAIPPLSFDTASTGAPLLVFLPVNTPGLVASSSQTGTSVTIELSRAPISSDVLGFWLNVNNSDPDLNNITTPIFFITAVDVQQPDSMTLTYNTSTGSFTFGDLTVPLAQTDIFYRLGLVPDGPGNQTVVMLVSTPDDSATFFDPAIRWSDGTTTPRDPSNMNRVTLDCPFVGGRALSMQFVISYNNALIYSPDPIVMDKQIGDNGQP